MDLRWYAIKTKSRHEKMASAVLRSMSYEEFLPLYLARRMHHGSARDAHLPLFPGYVFCRFAVEKRLPILRAPGVASIVTIGRVPAPVADDEIAAIQRVVSSVDCQPWPFLKCGDWVRIEEGPLRNLEGILVTSKGESRLVVNVELLQRAVAAEVDRRWVRPTGKRKPPSVFGTPLVPKPVRSLP